MILKNLLNVFNDWKYQLWWNKKYIYATSEAVAGFMQRMPLLVFAR